MKAEKEANPLIGPFVDYEENPILLPTTDFESKAVYNPAVIKEGDNFYMLYRAESEEPLTGRIALAKGKDGLRFIRHPEPVINPGDPYDLYGCEDPRIAKFDDTYYLTYVGNSGKYESGNICLATSKDLLHWEKHGALLQPKKGRWDSGQIKAGAIVPQKIGGRYVMYFMGEAEPWHTFIGIAFSDNLFDWYEPLDEPIICPREGYFDSHGVEPGPPPVIIGEEILLIYNGWREDSCYKPAIACFSLNEPSKLLKRTDYPILTPSEDWGKRFGAGNHIVAEGLVIDRNQWLLYYGAADRAICVAMWRADQ